MATTLEAIQAKVKKLQAQADALIAKKSATVLKSIHELTEQHGLTTADIDAHAGGKQRAKKAGTKAAAKGSASAAKYRDPKSGATWSGRGPAPAWLASAKDRSKFLIDSAGAAADSKPMVTKTVAKRAPTAKKTAAKKAVSVKVPAKKAPRKSLAVPAPVAAVESGTELTT